MKDRATLMVLGAGVSQVPGIRAAVARGLQVVTVDWDLRNPGHRYSHACVEVSTTDVDGVLRAARSRAPDGIVTFASDVATSTVAHVAEALGLPGCSPAAIRVLSNKGLLRSLQHARGLAAPRFAMGTDTGELRKAREAMAGPTMVKPVDSSGSRGVTLVAQEDERAFDEAVEHARSFSRTEQVCVEEFLPGEEVGGDAVIVDGAVAYLQCTHKWRRGFLVAGHSLPPNVTAQQQQAVGRAVGDLCHAAGYHAGVINFDVMVDGGQATVIEMSPRTGGNGIPALLAAVTGVDTVRAAIAFALGEAPRVAGSEARFARAGSVVLGVRTTGSVEQPRSEEQVRATLPELIEYVCEVPASGHASAWEHGGASLGYCVFGCPAAVSYQDMARRARMAIGIEGLVT
jgi:biotin carboxylase